MGRNLFLMCVGLLGISFSLQGKAFEAYEISAERIIIIDDDVGMLKSAVRHAGSYQAPWLPITDPDGGLELIYALRESGVKVLGITCTMGCSSTDVCVDSANNILELRTTKTSRSCAGRQRRETRRRCQSSNESEGQVHPPSLR